MLQAQAPGPDPGTADRAKRAQRRTGTAVYGRSLQSEQAADSQTVDWQTVGCDSPSRLASARVAFCATRAEIRKLGNPGAVGQCAKTLTGFDGGWTSGGTATVASVAERLRYAV